MTVPSQSQENQVPVAEVTKQNDKEYNFAQLRKQLEEERQARLKLEESIKTKQVSITDDDDDDEPYVDKKRLKKTLDKTIPQIKEEAKAEIRAELKKELDEERRSNYLRENTDFQQVLQAENIQRFAERNPRVAEAMLRMPDTFERQQLLYEQIKAMGMHKKEEPKIQDTINKNLKSPYYRPTSETSPPYAATGDFSETGQKNAYQKMQELIKNKRAM